MRILLFSVAYFPHVWWAEVAWQELTKRLPQHKRDMIVAKLSPRLPFHEAIGNVTVWRIGIGFPLFDKLLYLLVGPFLGLCLHFRHRFALCVGIMASWWGLAAMLFHRYTFHQVPYILNLQDGDTDEYIFQKIKYIGRLYKCIFASASQVSVIAHFLAQRARDNNFFGPIAYLPNGVDIPFFSSQHSSHAAIVEQKALWWRHAKTKVIVTTSRLNYKNGIESIINALPLLSDDHVFLCLGEGELRADLEAQITALWLEKRVYMPGFISHQKIIHYLSCADYFCRPSLQEGLWNSFLEAMVFGLPIVATPVGGIVDFLEEAKTGFFCAVHDPQSIADALHKIDALSSDAHTALLDSAKKVVIQRYDREHIAKQYHQLFLHIQHRPWNAS